MKTIRYLIVLILIIGLTSVAQAGNGPGGPGGPGGSTTPSPEPTNIPDTGELYGDLYVILRDEGGVPVLSSQGCIQPISAITDSTEITTIDGLVTINVVEGEPFALPTYTDAIGDLVECELTEDMADWVQAVDFGRLNLGRAPEGVIAHAFDEAIKKLNAATEIGLDPAGRLMLTAADGTISTIDAPAENLALYVEMMKYGDWVLENTDPVSSGGPPEGMGPAEGDGPSSEARPLLNETAIVHLAELGFTSLGVSSDLDLDPTLNPAELTLAASLLAAAADKGGSITLDKVVYINSIYGINQLGSLPGEVDGKTYYDFGDYTSYDRGSTYANRGSPECTASGASFVWVLQPELGLDGLQIPGHFVTTCMDLLGYDPAAEVPVNAVRFTDMTEAYTTVYQSDGVTPLAYNFIDNVRAFTQASDDALQVIEYIHNYKIPVELYP